MTELLENSPTPVEPKVSFKKARYEAQRILDKHWRLPPDGRLPIPVDPVAIAERIGLDVEMGDSKTHIDSYTLTLDQNLTEPERRFQAAHSLAHYALKHAPLKSENDRTVTLSCCVPDEAEANRFALELLIPSDALKEAVITRKETDPEFLSKVFGVEIPIVRFRMQGLGLIS